MIDRIEFFFEFSSPYGYLASERIEAIAARHQRETLWRPYLLGVIMKTSERRPLYTYPLIGEYSAHDIARCARYWRIPFAEPSKFPISTLAAARAYYAIEANDQVAAQTLAQALYRAYFRDDRDISDTDTVLAIAAEQGHQREILEVSIQSKPIKQRLREATDEALARKVAGSPFMFVDGEPFWGCDRLDQMDAWLERGGW
jgi:2-hydroxychromene-2-carboxylate isomerase